MWSGTGFEIQLTLIRHGVTIGNKEHRYIGRTDQELCEEGRKVLEEKKKQLPDVDIVFISPMLRCRESAEILYPGKEFIEIAEWTEMDFGQFEGKNYLELQENPAYRKWIDSNGTLPFPEGESREDFIERVGKGFSHMVQILQETENKLYRVGAVVHGGTIMALLSSLDGGEYFSYQVKNGAGYQCSYPVMEDEKYRWKVEKI